MVVHVIELQEDYGNNISMANLTHYTKILGRMHGKKKWYHMEIL